MIMKAIFMSQYPNKDEKELIAAFSALEDEKQITGFLRDILTAAEIEEFAKRFQIAKLLWTTNLPYVEIAAKVKTSTTTVTRVYQWLYKEPWQGYMRVLKKIYGDSSR